MKKLVAAAALCLAVSVPAYAQLGGLSKRVGQAKDAKDKADKVTADLKLSDAEERKLGEAVSEKLRLAFGVYQNKDVTKYVSLVGTVLGQSSSRPALDWQFIVLDTDGVNAFAAPGGLVHITRGALGLIRTEAELAGVLGHEITHVTAKHTVRSIQKNKLVSLTADEVGGGLAGSALSKLAEAAYKNVVNNAFDRDDEIESDKVGVTLASKVGYAPAALSDVLMRIAERNKDQAEPNGMFASHPLIKDRLSNIAKVIKDGKLGATATVAARYKATITFEAKPLQAIEVIAGTRGLTGGESAKSDSKDKAQKEEPKKEEPKKEEPKKKGGLLGKFSTSPSEQKQSSQTVASAGARGGVPDRDAKGGSNPNKLTVPVTPADVAEFKKGIA